MVGRSVVAFEFITLAHEPLGVEFIALSLSVYQFSKFIRWYFKIIFIHLLYHDTLKFSVNFDCIMIQWVSITKMKEAWNGSILLHLSCLYHFGYVHWMYHDTFKLWICIECIMIQSRVKPEILSSNCVLIRKLPPGPGLDLELDNIFFRKFKWTLKRF